MSAAGHLSRIKLRVCSRTQAGFTIFVMLVTLLLAVITIGMALPSLQGFSANNQIVAAGNSIESGLNFARFTAISTGDDITICPSEDGVSCQINNWHRSWIVFKDRDKDSIPASDEVLKVSELDGSQAAIGFGQAIVFRADGTTRLASDAVITSCYEHNKVTDKCLAITVSRLGAIASTEQKAPPEA